jgi:thymidine kinase
MVFLQFFVHKDTDRSTNQHMFIEPINHSQQAGWIEVVCGSMFSGKTEELIRRLKRAKIANMQVAIFKPSIDIRYHAGKIVSHDDNTINATPLKDSKDILAHAEAFNVVGIDEAQFFDAEIVHVCERLANAGKRVIVAGLDMDYTGKPFGPMPALLSVANFVTKLHAVCIKCGGIASYSYRISSNTDQVVLGEKDHYEARCRNCFNT